MGPGEIGEHLTMDVMDVLSLEIDDNRPLVLTCRDPAMNRL